MDGLLAMDLPLKFSTTKTYWYYFMLLNFFVCECATVTYFVVKFLRGLFFGDEDYLYIWAVV